MPGDAPFDEPRRRKHRQLPRAHARPPPGSLRILVVDDRLKDARAWSRDAEAVDPALDVRCAETATGIQNALLEGRWACVLVRQAPARLSLSAVLAMTQVLEPMPAVLLFPDADTSQDRRTWLAAAERAADLVVPRPPQFPPHRQADLDLGSMTIPSMFGPTTIFSSSDVEALRALRDSEERFRTLTEIAPVGIFLTDADQRCVYVNERWSEISGVPTREARGMDWRTCLQTGDATLEASNLFAADPSSPLAFENPIEQPGRATVWVIGQLRPYRDSHGVVVGHLGVITDITERKEAELAMRESEKRLRELSAHMNSVEERQRATIAREIHDDIGSALTGMKIDLLRVKQLTGDLPEVQEKIAAFTRLLDSTTKASTRIAKALRPSILDDGIVPAIDWQCREFARRWDIDAEFVEPASEPQLTGDQSIALFRVVQEALNNVAKHAQAKHVDVELFVTDGELTLEIRDDGRGLPPDRPAERVERDNGFGITGMRERVLSLGGWMDITGAPGQGTTVMVGIPVQEHQPERRTFA